MKSSPDAGPRFAFDRVVSSCSPRFLLGVSRSAVVVARRRTVWRGRTVLALGLMVAATACGSRQSVKPRADRAFGSIDVVGNKAFSRGDLLDGLASVRARDLGRPFEPSLVREDRARLRGQYVRRGYFAADVEFDIERKGRVFEVVFQVTEGPRAQLAGVTITGLPPDVDADELRQQIPLRDGAPFDYAPFDLAKPALVDQLAEHGYAHARVDATVDADQHQAKARIRLDVDAGAKARFGEVTVTGVEGPLAEAARRRLSIKQGALYSTSAISDSQDALYEMGRFASARIEPDRSGRGDVIPVRVTILESPRNEVRLGIGVGVDPASYQVRTRVGYGIAGFPEPLTTARVEIRPAIVYVRDATEAKPRVEATAGLERIDLFAPRIIGVLEGGYSYTTVEAYTSVGPRVRLGLRRAIYRKSVLAAVGWQLQYLRFPDVSPLIEAAGLDTALGLDHRNRVGFFEQSLVLDLRDDPFGPRQGVYAELRAEEGTVAAGGDLDYLRLTPELRGYVPFGPLVIASRARFGMITGEVPVTQRYFAGGAFSQRGFPERRLSPTVAGLVEDKPREVPYGGAAMLEVSGEVRAHLTTFKKIPLGGVLFLDGGDVTERIAGIDLGNLHWALGAGVRAQTVIGAVRFDLGMRLNRMGAGDLRPDERFAYHLSIGEAF